MFLIIERTVMIIANCGEICNTDGIMGYAGQMGWTRRAGWDIMVPEKNAV